MRCDLCVLGLVNCQARKAPRLCDHAKAGHEGYIKTIQQLTAAAEERRAKAIPGRRPVVPPGSCVEGCQLGLARCLGKAFPHLCEDVAHGDEDSKALILQTYEAGIIHDAIESLRHSPLGIGDSRIGTTRAFVSGGIGDFLAIESHLPERTRRTLVGVYYATKAVGGIRALLDAVPRGCFPNLSGQEVLVEDGPIFTLPHAAAAVGRPELLGRVEDWSIFREFPRIKSGELPFTGSSFLRYQLADISRFGLPSRFIAIHPFSVNDRRERRDFTTEDWTWLLEHLERADQVGIILGTGDDRRPTDPRLIDLTGQTSYPEAVEVLKAASGFIGVGSSLSVLAAQLFEPPNLIIRGPGRHVRDNRRIYYAPHREVFFLRPQLTYDTLRSYTYRKLDNDLSRAVEREIVVQTSPPRLDKPVRWIFVFGAWGDMICQLGYARHIRQTTGERVAIAVYWKGFTEDLEKFLAAQVDLADYRVIKPQSALLYTLLHIHWYGTKKHLTPKQEWLPTVLATAEGGPVDLPIEQVDSLPLLSDDALESPVHHFRGADLPKSSRDWARATVDDLRAAHPGRKILLLHPFSYNSTSHALHWPHWQAAVEWLSEQEGYTCVLTGLEVPDGWRTPANVVDLVGKVPSQCDVWALAEVCDGLVTTTNSLCLWSIVADRPAVVCANEAMQDRSYYFRRWAEAPQNRIVEWSQTLEEFKAAFEEKAPEFGREATPAPYRAPAYNKFYFDRYAAYDGSPMAEALNDARVELVRRHCPSDAAVLDVGIGSGAFMRAWEDVGGKAYGTDVNPIAKAWLEESGQWADPYKELPADVGCITTWDVLEHFESPGELLGRLPEGTVLCGSIPIFPDLGAEAIKASKHYRPDEHLWYATERGLTWYLADLGFVLLEINDAETQAGRESILSFAFRKDWNAARRWKLDHAPPLTIEEKRAALTESQRSSLLHCAHRQQRPGNCCGGVEDFCAAGHFDGRAIQSTVQCVECVSEGMLR
jgi:ADP-heptose:LPS heptosyltransferase